jgi:uncharacterized protein YbaR (Trm112 family)
MADRVRRSQKTRNDAPMTFKFKELEGLLVCPGSRTQLVQDGDSLVCVDGACRLKFAIRDEIPIMLVDEAAKLSPEEWQKIIERHPQHLATGK